MQPTRQTHTTTTRTTTTTGTALTPQDALIVVDMQNDFCPGGALAVTGGHEVVPVLNRWIQQALHGGAVIAATRDWHPANHCSFQMQGGPWPPHCVQNTPGAAFHPDICLPQQVWLVSKGEDPAREQYSDLDGTGLIERLRQRGVTRLWIGGLALDYCVRATVLDGLKAGFESHLILPATRAVNVRPDDGDRTLTELRQAGAVICDQ